MKIRLLNLLFVLMVCFSCTAQDEDDIAYVRRVTSEKNVHQAFTDLVFFDNQYFLVFRESDKHAYGKNGVIKLYNSKDCEEWILIKEINVEGIDLRDPKFAVNNDKLMLYIHGLTFQDKKVMGSSDYKSRYSEDKGWEDLVNVTLDKSILDSQKTNINAAWPWRVSWFNNKAYSIAYNLTGIFDLYQSNDGIAFNKINSLVGILNNPTEATIRINSTGEFYVLARTNNGRAIVGKSSIPNEEWDWFGEIPIVNFGGPNFLFTANDNMIISGREEDKVIIGSYDVRRKIYKKLLTLKSGGDCGYPGMIIKDDILWVSYYSSHESDHEAAIYLAKISLSKLKL